MRDGDFLAGVIDDGRVGASFGKNRSSAFCQTFEDGLLTPLASPPVELGSPSEEPVVSDASLTPGIALALFIFCSFALSGFVPPIWLVSSNLKMVSSSSVGARAKPPRAVDGAPVSLLKSASDPPSAAANFKALPA